MKRIKLKEIIFATSEELTIKEQAYFFIRKALLGFILAIIVNFGFSYFFHTPKLFSLSRENSELVLKFRILQEKISESNAQLEELRRRDNGIYRSIFAIDTTQLISIKSPQSTLADDTPLVGNVHAGLDYMRSQLYSNSVSLDTLTLLASDNSKLSRSVPSIWPIDKTLLRNHIGKYGYRIHPIFRYRHIHSGIDLSANRGTEIYATADGEVVSAKYDGGYGYSILVNHGYGYHTRYAHLSKMIAKSGQKVRRGELIGLMGSTGNSTGTHLHYEVIYRGRTVDPLTYLGMDMSPEEFVKILESAKDTTYE